MSEILKKCVFVSFDGTPVYVCEVRELKALEFVEKRKEAEKNLNILIATKKNKIRQLEDKVAQLEKEIKILKGEEEDEE